MVSLRARAHINAFQSLPLKTKDTPRYLGLSAINSQIFINKYSCLLCTKNFKLYMAYIKLHNNLNYTKGTIYTSCLKEIPDDEMIEHLKEQDVSIFKFLKYINQKLVPSGIVLLNFDKYHLPKINRSALVIRNNNDLLNNYPDLKILINEFRPEFISLQETHILQ